MRLLTYVFAAALLWAVATTGPATTDAARPSTPGSAAGSSAAQPPR
jgi:hypothetical protein